MVDELTYETLVGQKVIVQCSDSSRSLFLWKQEIFSILTNLCGVLDDPRPLGSRG